MRGSHSSDVLPCEQSRLARVGWARRCTLVSPEAQAPHVRRVCTSSWTSAYLTCQVNSDRFASSWGRPPRAVYLVTASVRQ